MMSAWTTVILLVVLSWIGSGRLVNSDTPSGRLARGFLAGIIFRLTGKEVNPDEPTDEDGKPT